MEIIYQDLSIRRALRQESERQPDSIQKYGKKLKARITIEIFAFIGKNRFFAKN